MKKKLLITLIVSLIPVIQNAYGIVLLDRVVAVVNNEVITWSEVRDVISREAKSYLEKVPEGHKEEVMAQLEKDYLNSLIDVKLQLQEARKKRLGVSDAEIDSAIEDITKKYNLNAEALKVSLEAEGMTMESYRDRLGEQILLSKVVSFEVKANVVVTDREVGEYYEANKDRLSSSEKRKIRQIFFAMPKDNSQKPSVEAKAREVVLRIQGGEDFSKLAGELSEDASRQFGGDLGYIDRGSVLKEVEDAAFGLNTGEVSKPFWSSAGLHIIKLEDKVEGLGLDKLQDKIKETLLEKAFEAKYLQWKAGLKERAYIEMKL